MSRLFSSSPLILGLIEDIDINSIKPSPHLYRNATDDVSDLAVSIQDKGVLQPILVRSRDSYYEIIAGHRRYKACKFLGWRKIICHVIELDDKEAFEVSLIENIQRKTFQPKEEALAFKDYVINFGWGGISDLATKISKSTSYVQRRIKLLELPEDILDSISNSSISTTAAEELLSLKSKPEQSQLSQLVFKNRLSSRKVRELVKNFKESSLDNQKGFPSPLGTIVDIDRKTLRAFDKSIIALKGALNKFGGVISEVEDNWIAYEILMQHKNMLNNQIDLLIKQKKKL